MSENDAIRGEAEPKPVHVRVGETLRKVRQDRGYTVAELAKVAGVGVTTVRDLESGRAGTTLVTLSKIAAALDTTVRVMLTPVEHLEEPEWHRNIWLHIGKLAANAVELEQRVATLELASIVTATPRKGAVQSSGVPNSGTEGTDENE